MRRVQSFEFNELSLTPTFIRDSITEVLGLTWAMSNQFNPVGSSFAEFCKQTGCKSVLDLGSGSGEPVTLLVDGLRKKGMSGVRFFLSDLFPKISCMEKVAARYPEVIDVIHKPVDATNIPGDINADVCSIMGVFHHFPPHLASAILKECYKKRRAVFIIDAPRNLSSFIMLTFPLVAFLALLVNPIIADNNRLLKALFTYLIPVIPLSLQWDGMISSFRMYSETHFLEMVKEMQDGYTWEYREIKLISGFGIANFVGIPQSL